MYMERKQPLTTVISCGVAVMLAGFFVTGCGRESADSNAPSPPNPENPVVGVVLRADPNPVPGGKEMGKTRIIWQTGSEAAADIYYVNGAEETLFASGARGSKEATFIRPGTNEFRMYNQGQKKLVTKLIVGMPGARSSGTPASPAAATSQ